VHDKAKQIYDEMCMPFVAGLDEVFLYLEGAPYWRTFLMICLELMQHRNKYKLN